MPAFLAAYVRNMIYFFHIQVLCGDHVNKPFLLLDRNFSSESLCFEIEVTLGDQARKACYFWELLDFLRGLRIETDLGNVETHLFGIISEKLINVTLIKKLSNDMSMMSYCHT
jgi:hypothetical protein